MRYLNHDSGEAATLHNAQILGDESPLEFDEDGRAGPLDDDIAAKVAAMDRHVTVGRRDRDGGDPDECPVVKTDGEVCGRELPCQYHDGEDA